MEPEEERHLLSNPRSFPRFFFLREFFSRALLLQRISAQKLLLISCRVARTYVSVSDRRISHGFLMRLKISLILTSA